MKNQFQTFLAIVLALAFPFAGVAQSLAEDPRAITLPLEFEINGRSQGEAIVRATPSLDVIEIEGSLLKRSIGASVADELIQLVESLPDEFTSLSRLRELGLEIHLDLERLVIVLSIAERAILDEEIQRIHLGYQKVRNYADHQQEAHFSGYLNLNWRSRHTQADDSATRLQHSLGIDHVFNLRGYALEGESVWNESEGLETRELRLVRDFPGKLWRLGLGDISTPIANLQQGYRLFGLNLSKEFGIDPYTTFRPTGNFSFQIEESASVRVLVNGSPTRTLRLEPGNYSIEDFKLAAGENHMQLDITTDSGLSDQLNVNAFGSFNLLGEGVSTYSLSLGLPRASEGAVGARELVDLGFYRRSVEDEPLLSGYYSRGLSQRLTLGSHLQGGTNWQRAGLNLATASRLAGELNLAASLHSSASNPTGWAGHLHWSRKLAGIETTFTSSYSSPYFDLKQAGQRISPSSIQQNHSIGLSKVLGNKAKTTAALRASLQKSFDGHSQSTISGNLGRRFGAVYASATLRHSQDARSAETGGFLTFTWSPAPKWRARSQLLQSDARAGSEASTQLSYANRLGERFLSADLNARYGSTGHELEGGFRLQDAHYALDLTHAETYRSVDDLSGQGRETAFAFNTALAFADGAFGLADRIDESFAIIANHAAWKNVALGINPTLGGYEKTGSGRGLSPVLSSLRSYRESYAFVQTIDSELFLERNDLHFFPGYRRGAKVTVGNDAIYALRSSLRYQDGTPVAYKAIQFIRGEEVIVSAFTNAIGRFVASGLRPGDYLIKVANTHEVARWTVVEGSELMRFEPEIALGSPEE